MFKAVLLFSAIMAAFSSVHSSCIRPPGKCDRTTTSGDCCVFPFTYKGKRYTSCTRVNHNRPWCATTDSYDVDKKWGNCAPAQCPLGWTGFESSCYIVLDIPTNQWQVARRACQQLCGDLVKITSARENKFVTDLGIAGSKASGVHFLWIGLHRGAHRAFYWTDGSSLASTGYSRWGSGEPNSPSRENCAHLLLRGYWAHKAFEWNDTLCDWSSITSLVPGIIACERKR